VVFEGEGGNRSGQMNLRQM